MKWKRPTHCPREITSHWPGASYPCETGVQFRIQVNGVRFSLYLSYSDFDDDAVAAHEHGAAWRMKLQARRKFTLRCQLRERVAFRRDGGVPEYSFVLPIMKPDGTRTLKRWGIGTSNTATPTRRKRAREKATQFLAAYRRWYEQGGRHPMEVRR